MTLVRIMDITHAVRRCAQVGQDEVLRKLGHEDRSQILRHRRSFGSVKVGLQEVMGHPRRRYRQHPRCLILLGAARRKRPIYGLAVYPPHLLALKVVPPDDESRMGRRSGAAQTISDSMARVGTMKSFVVEFTAPIVDIEDVTMKILSEEAKSLPQLKSRRSLGSRLYFDRRSVVENMIPGAKKPRDLLQVARVRHVKSVLRKRQPS